jgi:hypothetical protein
MNRRTALKLGTSLRVLAGAGVYSSYRLLPPRRSSALESVDTLAGRLYIGLDAEQRAETRADFAYYDENSVVGRLRPGLIRSGDIYSLESWRKQWKWSRSADRI